MSQLNCSNVTLGYDNNIILENLSFTVNKGDYLCIIGGNGTGKTTLMKAILGLKKQVSGDITWGDGLRNNEIGYLTQQSEIQREFPASVKEVVMSGFQSRHGLFPFYNKAEKTEALSIMERLGIANLKNRCYRNLSGGQQQRVLLSRALCATSKMLFLDEPVTGLDPEISAEMYSAINDLNTKDKVTIIMISHDVTTALNYATHILQIGDKPFFGTRDEYLTSVLHCSCDCHTAGDANE